MNKSVSVYEAKATLSKILELVVKEGGAVTVCKHGRPVADIVPHRPVMDRLQTNPALRGAKFLCDPCEPVDVRDWPEDLR